jgi:ubiquinone/menaquinone biosynthesis C-methylase UbiE
LRCHKNTYGGLKGTRELIASCHIKKGKYVLGVGCGIRKASCYTTKRLGCKVVGIDISERMIVRGNERMKREV